MRAPFFRRKPPKTAGREEFGREFVDEFLRRCGRSSKRDCVGTATALSARSIGDALRRFVAKRSGRYKEFVVSLGVAKNLTMRALLANEIGTLRLELRLYDAFGLPSV